jgi:signal transduction histidine kinase
MTGKFFRDLRMQHRIVPPRDGGLIRLHDLQDMLIRLIEDQQLVSDPDENHAFVFEPRDLERTYYDDINGHRSLLEQMVSNLLENADKYSYTGSTITLRGLRTRDSSRFFLEVENRGYPIGREEVRLIRQRGGRGREAIMRVAEGQGIGLYIVDEIIRSFRGSLEIMASTERDTPHRFRLYFPPASNRT